MKHLQLLAVPSTIPPLLLLLLLLLLPTTTTAAPILLSRDINAFLAEIALLFPFSGLIADISGLLIGAEQILAFVFGVRTTRDDLLAGAACGPVTVIYARGTTEPGNVGVLVGPPFFDALRSRIVGAGAVVVQGVHYPASVEGFLVGGDAAGARTMANLVTQAHSQCPKTKVVMAAYSQGGQVLHKAAALLPASTMAAVSSVVIFGDPDDGAPVANIAPDKTLIICHEGDDICLHGDLILLPHLTYALNAAEAADFVASHAGF